MRNLTDRKNIRFNKISIFMCLILLLTALCAGTVYANVDVSDEEAKNLNTVTIAGNPDFYPYEYYDEESGTYKGLFPDLMEIVSEKTGIDFEYVYAGTTDQQLYQAKTGNAEMLTAFIKDDDILEDYNLTYGTTVTTYQSENTEIGIAYTRFVINGTDEQINEALSEISSDQILSILSKYIGNEPQKEKDTNNNTAVYIIIAALVALIIALVIVLIVFLHKRHIHKQDSKIDRLTGLYNREYFESNFEKFIGSSHGAIYSMAYIAFDIIKVNSVYGEEAAEEQLVFAAEQLRNMKTSSQDMIVRYGGGSFIFLHVCSTEKQTEEWISGAIKNLNAYMKKYEKDYKPVFRGGVYRMGTDFQDKMSAVSDAQRSYQQAVDNEQLYYITASDDSAKNLIRKSLKKRVSKALTDDEFKQFFQPIVDAGTANIVGAEALSRWFHPDMGILSPGRYVGMMEEDGTISELDLTIFEKTCMKLEMWQKEGCNLWISTNFTRFTLSSYDFNQKIHEIIGKYDFDHSKCVIEITEDCLENNVDLASQNVKNLSEMGFRIAIDDLGNGYTFFSDFINYKIDMVKIDRELLLRAEQDEGKALMKGIVDMCKNLGIHVLIEGVETKKQLDFAGSLNCDYIQGFYYYRPMSENDFNDLKITDGNA